MPIMSDVKLIEKVPLRLVNLLVGPLSLDRQRNKILLPYLWSKQSMLPPVIVVHNYYRRDKLLRTIVTL
jgi:hypothetical protein